MATASRIYLSRLGSLIGDTFVLQNPVSISAVVKDESNTTIESPTPTNESTGIYYVELDDTLYTSSQVYNITWTLEMISGFSQSFTTRFYYNASVSINTTRIQVTDVVLKVLNKRYKLYIKERLALKIRRG